MFGLHLGFKKFYIYTANRSSSRISKSFGQYSFQEFDKNSYNLRVIYFSSYLCKSSAVNCYILPLGATIFFSWLTQHTRFYTQYIII